MKTNWQTKKLGDLLELCDAGTWGEEDPKGLPLLRSTNMQNGNLVLDDVKTIALPKDKIDQYTLLEGDILMTKSSGSVDHIGKSLFITSKMSGKYGFSNFTQRLRPDKSQVLPMWIYYKVSDPATRDFLLGASQTTTGLRNLKISQLRELEIPLPPLDIQRQIVAILDEKFAKLREAKRLREEAIADTEKILSATLREIFKEGKEKGWEEKTINDVCLKVTDGSHNPPTKTSSRGEYLMLSSRNIYDGYMTFDNARYMSKENFELENRRTDINAGDVLLTIVGTIGRCTVVMPDQQKFTVQRSVAVLKPKDILNSFYLSYWLRGPLIQDFLMLNARGAAQKGFYLKDIKALTILVPSLTEQKEIVTRLDTLSEKLRTLRELQQSQLDDMKKLEKAYLREAFNGELV